MRYAFLVAGWVLPWMRGRLEYRYWRKVVTATAGIALVVAAADVLPRRLTVTGLVVALALLAESFGTGRVVALAPARPVCAAEPAVASGHRPP